MGIKSLLPNLKVRMYELPSGYLQIRYYENGKEVRKSYHLKYNDQNIKLMEQTQIPLIQQYLAQGKPTRVIGKDSLKQYLEQVVKDAESKSVSTHKTYQIYQNQIVDFFEKKYPKEFDLSITVIQTNMFEKLIEQLRQNGKSKSTIELVIALLKMAYKKAVKQHGKSVFDIFSKIDVPIVNDKKETIPFDIAEVQTLLQASDGDLKTAIVLCFFLGLRIAEATGLKWSDIDFTNERILIQRQKKDGVVINTTKSKKLRIIPLYPTVKKYLQTLPKEQEYIITTDNIIHLSKQLTKIIAQNNLSSQFRRLFHRLRHANASVTEASGESMTFVQKALGHADIQTTKIYTHLIDGVGNGQKIGKFFDENFEI